ncbi:MAG: hypothetical protein HOM52_07510 [Rhodospirillaceae bacterium]|jgi:hypothetical protein|nr:hypothetical protein [Rhodospirillaceae bacterium]MBT3627716.1 hypothetical protein [Rhodospirillaceae bacterium]MBT4426461.1 hypothetical protein [Rhodospirillaceae bacterium]MBT5038342.1 hypothetical protein [Rhodospirillaceae bacterium]MBT5674315.1 hypothetical protein [Rhodospirillaceae bacterium]
MIDGAAELVAAAQVANAMDYPFSRPDHSYLFADGAVLALESPGVEYLDDALARKGAATMADRTAVLAYGANAAPARLQRKFEAEGPGAVFPVVKARLFDFDIVHACHYSSYGAVPATLAPSPGTVAEVALTYLDQDQLARMHETELSGRRYVYGLLGQIRVQPEGLAARNAVHSYWTGYGYFAGPSGPLALSAIAAEGRRFAAAAQEDMQIQARDRLAPGRDMHDFVHENIADPGLRHERSLALSANAKPFDHPHCQILDG